METDLRQRQLALAPFLETLTLPDSGASVPSCVICGEHELELEPWVGRYLSNDAATTTELRRLLSEGLAFEAKRRSWQERLTAERLPGPSELATLLEELVVDVAVGLALQRDLQSRIDHCVVAGGMEQARHLTGFRNRIGQCITGLKTHIGAEAIARAERMAPGLTAPAVADDHVRAPLVEEEESRPLQFKKDSSYRPAQHVSVRSGRASFVKPMLVLLGLLVVCYAGVMLALRPSGDVPPTLGRSDFAHLPAVTQVVARPPSLFIKVAVDDWNGMKGFEKVALLDELAAVAGAAGYRGVHVRTTEDLAVGQWMQKTGSQLLDQAPDGFAGS